MEGDGGDVLAEVEGDAGDGGGFGGAEGCGGGEELAAEFGF